MVVCSDEWIGPTGVGYPCSMLDACIMSVLLIILHHFTSLTSPPSWIHASWTHESWINESWI